MTRIVAVTAAVGAACVALGADDQRLGASAMKPNSSSASNRNRTHSRIKTTPSSVRPRASIQAAGGVKGIIGARREIRQTAGDFHSFSLSKDLSKLDSAERVKWKLPTSDTESGTSTYSASGYESGSDRDPSMFEQEKIEIESNTRLEKVVNAFRSAKEAASGWMASSPMNADHDLRKAIRDMEKATTPESQWAARGRRAMQNLISAASWIAAVAQDAIQARQQGQAEDAPMTAQTLQTEDMAAKYTIEDAVAAQSQDVALDVSFDGQFSDSGNKHIKQEGEGLIFLQPTGSLKEIPSKQSLLRSFLENAQMNHQGVDDDDKETAELKRTLNLQLDQLKDGAGSTSSWRKAGSVLRAVGGSIKGAVDSMTPSLTSSSSRQAYQAKPAVASGSAFAGEWESTSREIEKEKLWQAEQKAMAQAVWNGPLTKGLAAYEDEEAKASDLVTKMVDDVFTWRAETAVVAQQKQEVADARKAAVKVPEMHEGMIVKVQGLEKTHMELNGQVCKLLARLLDREGAPYWKAHCAQAPEQSSNKDSSKNKQNPKNKIFEIRESKIVIESISKQSEEFDVGRKVFVKGSEKHQQAALHQVCTLKSKYAPLGIKIKWWNIQCDADGSQKLMVMSESAMIPLSN